jgi:hypothetical protein
LRIFNSSEIALTRLLAEAPNTGVLEPASVARLARGVCRALAGPATGVAQAAATVPLLLPLLLEPLLLLLLLLPELLLLEPPPLLLLPPLLLEPLPLLELELLPEPPEPPPQAASAAQAPSSRPIASPRFTLKILSTMISPDGQMHWHCLLSTVQP